LERKLINGEALSSTRSKLIKKTKFNYTLTNQDKSTVGNKPNNKWQKYLISGLKQELRIAEMKIKDFTYKEMQIIINKYMKLIQQTEPKNQIKIQER